ncbi:hypothetical protein D3C87_1868050 [compost metagenome]
MARVAQHDDARAVRLGHFHQTFHEAGWDHARLLDDQDGFRIEFEAVFLTCLQNRRYGPGFHSEFPQGLDLLAVGRHGLDREARSFSGLLDLGQHVRLAGSR